MKDKPQDVNQANSLAITAQLEEVIPDYNEAIVELAGISTLVIK